MLQAYSFLNFTEYLLFFCFSVICVFVTSAILGASFALSEKNTNLEKLSAYECGFDRTPSISLEYKTFTMFKKHFIQLTSKLM